MTCIRFPRITTNTTTTAAAASSYTLAVYSIEVAMSEMSFNFQ